MAVSAFQMLNQHRDLLYAWTSRTIRARYKQSIVGGLWAILQPVATVAIFTVLFTQFIKIDSGKFPYILLSYTAMAPWTFFSASVGDMVDSLTSNMNLVSKIYFPREIFPISALLARLLDFAIAITLLLVIMIYYQVPLFRLSWLWFPVILLIQLALALGLGFIGGALNVFYRDVRHLFSLGLQLWLYATPIVYPLSVVPEQWRTLYALNPMVGIIESYRGVLLEGQGPGLPLLFSAIIALLLLSAGYWLFKRVEFQFADLV
jgi:lipopolysaccharide transport system permease protein